MDKLSASLQAKINSRPTQTVLHTNDDTEEKFNQKRNYKYTHIPDNFNGKEIWKDFLTPVMDQGTCGSCWAFSATSMLSSRFNIQSRGVLNIQLSPAKLILCDWNGKEFDIKHPEKKDTKNALRKVEFDGLKSGSCFGNSIINACQYLFAIGTPTEKCVPYNKPLGHTTKFKKLGDFIDDATEIPFCTKITGPIGDMCSDYYFNEKTKQEFGTPERFYKCLHYYGVNGVSPKGNEYQIRRDIYLWGPIITGMIVYSDFYKFDPENEIYEWDGHGYKVGGHGIEIVGWGVDKDKPYWLIKNSWGKSWGMNGYFRMIRGKNNCSIEENCIGMVPDYFYPPDFNFKFTPLYTELLNIESPNERKLRAIAANPESTGGGIDLATGYTRRTMKNLSKEKLARPISLKTLLKGIEPEWANFIAANIISKKMMINDVINNLFSSGLIYIYVIINLFGIIFLIAILLRKYLKKIF